MEENEIFIGRIIIFYWTNDNFLSEVYHFLLEEYQFPIGDLLFLLVINYFYWKILNILLGGLLASIK